MTEGEHHPMERARPFSEKVPSRFKRQLPWWLGSGGVVGLAAVLAAVGAVPRCDGYAKTEAVNNAIESQAAVQAEKDKGQDERAGRMEALMEKFDRKLDRVLERLPPRTR